MEDGHWNAVSAVQHLRQSTGCRDYICKHTPSISYIHIVFIDLFGNAKVLSEHARKAMPWQMSISPYGKLSPYFCTLHGSLNRLQARHVVRTALVLARCTADLHYQPHAPRKRLHFLLRQLLPLGILFSASINVAKAFHNFLESSTLLGSCTIQLSTQY